MEAATCIQRRLRGVLGRRRATEERWRRLQASSKVSSVYVGAQRVCGTPEGTGDAHNSVTLGVPLRG